MRPINLVVVHCTATPEGKQFTVADIRRMHLARGFSDIGYHFLIGLNGEIWTGRPIEKIGAHVKGHNTGSVGISYVGGVTASGKAKDTRTTAQKSALRRLLADLVAKYPIKRILGHRDLSPDMNGDGRISSNEWTKECPCFNAIPEYSDLLGRRF